MCGIAEGAEYPAPQQGDWIVRDFRFHTGDVLPELRLHYTTVGAPTGTPVLLLHGTGRDASSLLTNDFAGELFGLGQPLDASRHFIILPDSIGHGRSSKPSDGLRTRFPKYNYDDMVQAQYRLLTEHLGIRHVRVIVGISMGGMHVWLWGEKYPGFMDALVPLASTPAPMAGRNWMLRRLLTDAIRQDPGWNGGNYTQQPAAWRKTLVFFNIATAGGALALYTATPTREQTDAELDKRLAETASTDTNDVLYQYDSSRDYDPSAGLERITARVLAINSADDERNPPELGLMEQAMKRLKSGRYVLLPITSQSRGHGTTGNARLWKSYLAEVLPQTGSVQ
jgi:homoserine O-acetyltransferase